jgi:hypothetical protein
MDLIKEFIYTHLDTLPPGKNGRVFLNVNSFYRIGGCCLQAERNETKLLIYITADEFVFLLKIENDDKLYSKSHASKKY